MIFIFRTNVQNAIDVGKLAPLLNRLFPIWNFDLEDCDKILRIEAAENVVKEAVVLLTASGFSCEELE